MHVVEHGGGSGAIWMDPAAVRMMLQRYDTLADELDTLAARQAQALAAAAAGDGEGFLSGGIDTGYASVQQIRTAAADLRQLVQNAALTVQQFEQVDTAFLLALGLPGSAPGLQTMAPDPAAATVEVDEQALAMLAYRLGEQGRSPMEIEQLVAAARLSQLQRALAASSVQEFPQDLADVDAAPCVPQSLPVWLQELRRVAGLDADPNLAKAHYIWEHGGMEGKVLGGAYIGLSHVRDLFTGFGQGAVDAVVGIKDLVVYSWWATAPMAHLIDAERAAAARAQGQATLTHLATTDPRETLGAMWDGLTMPYVEAWEDGRPMQAVGRGIFDIGSLFVGVGVGSATVRGTTTTSQVLRTADVTADGVRVVKVGRNADEFIHLNTSRGNSQAFVEATDLWQVNTGGLRGDVPLSDVQKEAMLNYLRQIAPDLPEERVRFVDHLELNTAYGPNFDMLQIGSDVLPSPDPGLGTLSANSRVSWRGALAHEIIGHREGALANRTQSVQALEEAQASIRAARFAPELTDIERVSLLRDGITRLHNSGIRIREVKDSLFIHYR